MRFVFILLLTVVIYACNSSSSNKKQEDDSLQYYPPTPEKVGKEEFRRLYRDISTHFDTGLLKQGFHGGILIAKNGEVIYEKYSGKKDLRKDSANNLITDTNALHIASTSKTFTGVAVLRLAQQNKLSLNDTLQKYFPSLPYPGITVQMLLNHRSGLPNYLYFMSNEKWGIGPNKKWNRQFATNEDVLQMMVTKKPDPTGKPGTKFSYCNTNYVMLALIIERVTGRKFPDYMEESLFRPLQMNNTFVFRLRDTLTAVPSFTNKNTYWEYDFLDATYGDKNVYTTPRDLLKWDQALYTDQVINYTMQDSAWKGYSFEEPGVENYGLGFRLQLLPNGKKVVYHFGKWHGFNAAFARLVEEKATVIVLGNKFNRAIYGAALLCYDVFGDYQQKKFLTSPEADSLPVFSKKDEDIQKKINAKGKKQKKKKLP
jgi:CubicO group peptidase (beta-lactamase class C family)